MADTRFFKVAGPFKLSELAEHIGGELRLPQGISDITINDVAPLESASDNTISFLDNVKYKDDFIASKAAACIVNEAVIDLAPTNMALIVTSTPYKGYALIAQKFYPTKQGQGEIFIHASAFVDETAQIGEGCYISAGAVVERNAKIGANTVLKPNAVIAEGVEIGEHTVIGANASITHALIGNNVNIYPGVRIGQDGFGFAIDPAGHVKVPQLGRVVIEDSVEIGANTTIDRGAGPDTIVGQGTWIDNLVQIGHNVKIGRGCIIIAQTGVAGSSIIEDYAVLAAQVGVAGHLTIGMGAQIGAQSGVMRDVPSGEKYFGSPALPAKQKMREIAMLKKMINSK